MVTAPGTAVHGSSPTAAFVSFQSHSHPPQETQSSFNCYASTVLLLYQRHKVTTLGKKPLIKMQYHANSFVQVGPRFKKEQHSLLSCLLRLQHSTKKLPGKREVLQLSSMRGYDRLFPVLKIRLEKDFQVMQSKLFLKHSN